MTRSAASSDDFASLCQEVRAELGTVRAAVDDNALAIASLTAVIRELMAARRADREVLIKILEACTREGDSKVADAIKHIEAGVGVLVEDTRAIREAVIPPARPETAA